MSRFDDDYGPWNTPKQAAPKLGFHHKTIQEMCAAGRIDCRRINGRYTISDRTIAQYNRSVTQKAS